MSQNLEPSEPKKRQLMRETYLNYFKNQQRQQQQHSSEYSDDDQRHWICSLNDMIQRRLQYPEKCRLAYTFVLGGNPNGPTMLLTFNDSYPLTVAVDPRTTKDKNNSSEKTNENDLVYLNIQENGKFGKSPTWFKYATTLLRDYNWTSDFDYVFKTDSDNLLFPSTFFHFVDTKLKKHPTRVYGGRPITPKQCGWPKHDHCGQMVGPIFNGGGCYFLSVDLAEFISNASAFDHEAVKLPHEDMTTGNFVHSHPLKIHRISEKGHKPSYRDHPIKDYEAYEARWNNFLRKEQETTV
jgi:hypothetical protein